MRLALAFAGCLACGTSTPDVADAGSDAAFDADVIDASGFLTDTPTTEPDAGGVLVDDVTYPSGSLVIHGIVCRPPGASARPLVMLNHGGFMGIDPTTRQQCIGFAQLGIVAGVSSYRGEDSSGGAIEVCLGEVDDVLAMKSVLQTMPWVDATRVAAVGFSHGACITDMMAIRDPTLRAAVDFFGPADIAAAYTFWQTELGNGEQLCQSTAQSTSTCTSLHNYLVSTVKTALGGTPTEKPAAYTARSPAVTMSTLAVPLMIFQGTYDYAIDLSQACTKRSITNAHAWYLDAALQVKPSTVCGGNFETAPLPSTFPDAAYLFVYEAQTHGFTGAAFDSAGTLAVQFLLSRLQ